MTDAPKQNMRDAVIGRIYKYMQADRRIFFLSADLGARMLDRVRQDLPEQFINVGIAEQNLINVATGLALEGCTVYAYLIAPFIMRAYEQIRVNLAISSTYRKLNVNIIGLGAGVSYDVAGPTHHALEDLILMRTLPNLEVFSPSDWRTAEAYVERTLAVAGPKYIRLDGKPVPAVYDENSRWDWSKGFSQLAHGDSTLLVSTGHFTYKAMRIVEDFKVAGRQIGLVDVFMLKPIDEDAIFNILQNYTNIITLEEGFIHKGGLDDLVLGILNRRNSKIPVHAMGFNDRYLFEPGSREFMHDNMSVGKKHIMAAIEKLDGSARRNLATRKTQ